MNSFLNEVYECVSVICGIMVLMVDLWFVVGVVVCGAAAYVVVLVVAVVQTLSNTLYVCWTVFVSVRILRNLIVCLSVYVSTTTPIQPTFDMSRRPVGAEVC